MFIELVDILRCPREHEDSWLVAVIHEKADRDIITGRLGCPICRTEYPITDGIAIFGHRATATAALARSAYDETADDAAMRCAAMLDLFDPGGAVLLGGSWGRAASALIAISPVSILLLDPPRDVPIGAGVSAIRAGDRLPIAAGSLRGIALDDQTSTPTVIETAVRSLRSRARLVAPVSAAFPAGILERARDDHHWVGELDVAASPPIPLTRQRSAST